MDYQKFMIKEYKHWKLYLHEEQYPYIGRCYAWSTREDAKALSDMNKVERDELFDIVIPQWTKTVKELFKADWINASFLGNTTPHVHLHLVPRYHSDREFAGVVFHDPKPDENYSPYEKMPLSDEIIFDIKEKIKKAL